MADNSSSSQAKCLDEEALRKLQAEWAEQRRQQQSDLDATRRQLEQQRQQLQREHDEALRRLQLNWETERQQLRTQWAADLDAEKQTFAEERAAFEADRDSERAVTQREPAGSRPYLTPLARSIRRWKSAERRSSRNWCAPPDGCPVKWKTASGNWLRPAL